MFLYAMGMIASLLRTVHATRDFSMSVFSACWLWALSYVKTGLESPCWWYADLFSKFCLLLIIATLWHRAWQVCTQPCAVPGARLRESSTDVACGPDACENLPALPENLPRVVQRAHPHQPAGSGQMQTNLVDVSAMQVMLERDMLALDSVRDMFRLQAREDYTRFVQQKSDAVFDGASALEVESMWIAHRHLRDQNYELAKRSWTRMQNASHDSYQMWSRFERH